MADRTVGAVSEVVDKFKNEDERRVWLLTYEAGVQKLVAEAAIREADRAVLALRDRSNVEEGRFPQRDRSDVEDERFARATKINAKDYSGWVYWEDHGDKEGFFSSVAELIEYCADHEIAGPEYAYACDSFGLSLDADDIVESAAENHHEDALGGITKAEMERLQAFLDEWCAAQNVVSYTQDPMRVVLLNDA